MKLHHHHPPAQLVIRDVTLRAGLQHLPQIIPTEDKLAVLDALVDAGVKNFQLTSLVNPARMPQMADAEAVYKQGVQRGLNPHVLVVNLQGFERAVALGVKSVDAVVSASNTHNRRNANRTTLESANEIIMMLSRAAHAGCTVGVSISNCFHCNSEGPIDPEMVLALTRGFHDAGARTVWIADTTGHGKPDAVARLAERTAHIGVEIGLHLHDTYGHAGDNLLAGYKAGVRLFDAALSGLEGSPFTPGIGGTLSWETVQAVFGKAGIDPGLNAGKLQNAREALAECLTPTDRAGAA
jgi:hydroxymethylglutaryl-CoA lyase